jgi:ABC-type amino acid transport substrate-binding protein
MVEEYNLEDVRKLLSDAFNADELETLAFDLFPEFAPNLTGFDHAQKTHRITDFAHRRGRIDEILAYVKEKVPYQYKRYLIRSGDRFMARREFDKAIENFREAGDDHRFKQAEAEKRRVALEELEKTAIEFEKKEEWTAAEKIYRHLVALDPDNKRWIEAVDRTENEQLLNELYAEALQYIQQENWEEAEETLVRIIHIRATYRDSAQLLAEVARKSTLHHREVGEPPVVVPAEPLLAPPQPNASNETIDEQELPSPPPEQEENGRRPAIPATALVLLLILVLIGVGWFVFREGNGESEASTTATTSPTPTIETPSATASTTPAVMATPTPSSLISAPPASPEEAVALLRATGVITAGVRDDAPPFGAMVDGELQGFDIDLVREFAARWLGDPDAVKLEPITADDRMWFLQNREGDLIAAAFSYSPERCNIVDCSQTYVLDGARLLVPIDSPITSVCDLEGEFVAVLDGTSGERNIQDAARWCDYSIPPRIRTYNSRDEAIEAVRTGVVAAYTTDGRILEQFADDGLKVVGDEFSPEEYRLAVPQGDDGLLALIDLTLQEMKADGTYDALHEKWFGCRSAPFPIVIESTSRPDFVKRAVTPVPSDCNWVNTVEVSHEIAAGETLGGIATNHYGDFDLYVCIQEANSIADIRQITIGTELTLPPFEECQAMIE